MLGAMATQNQFQQKLATWVVLVGSAISGLCAMTAIVAVGFGEPGKETSDAAKQILTILLPVVGTWVGTVLAFYFGRENFEAGARETRLSLGHRLSDPALKDAIPLAGIKAIKVADEAAARAVQLSRIDAELRSGGFFRLPILTTDNRPLYVVHRQPLDTFVADKARTPPAGGGTIDLTTLTLGDLVTSPEGAKLAGSFVTIPQSATLADAKTAMESRKDCQDVFITSRGTAAEPILAWLTNNEIQRASLA
jgi:hypothetical protein